MNSWWYLSGDERNGPVSDEELHRLLIGGRVTSSSLVWKEGMQSWEPASQVKALAPMLASLPPAIPPTQVKSPKTPDVSAPMHGRRLTTILAGAFLLAVSVGIAVYTRSAAGLGHGLAHLAGQAIVPLALTWAIVRKRERLRWDYGLVAVGIFLIFINGPDILATYDFHHLQRELRSAANPEDRENVLANSTTQAAAMLRGVKAAALDEGTKIAAIFAELEDSLPENPLSPEDLNDIDKLNQAAKVFGEKAALARTAMPRIDAIMANGLEQNKKLASGFSEPTALMNGVGERQARHRVLYQRRADWSVEFLETLAATLAFVSSRSGSYRIRNGVINFGSTEDAARYGAYDAKIQALASQGAQLDKNYREEQDKSAGYLDAIAQ